MNVDPTVVVAAPVGELDITRLDEVDAMLASAPLDGRLIVDLSAVQFVDSVTLSRFVRALRRREVAGGRLVLAGAHGAVRRVLSITRLDAVLPYEDDVELARAYLRALD
jgi:anti-sigma B factor antagonist